MSAMLFSIRSKIVTKAARIIVRQHIIPSSTTITRYPIKKNRLSSSLSSSTFSSSFSSSSSVSASSSLPTPPPHPPLPPTFLSSLASIPSLPPPSTNPYDLQRHGRGESYHSPLPPQIIVTPPSTFVVSEVVKLCALHRIPIIPFGVGTSLEGHVGALRGGLCMDMSLMTEMDVSGALNGDFMAVVGAGVTRRRLNEELRHTGMQFMVDPGADATIGGMVACSASGTSSVKYGTMKENTLALEAVLPNGTIVNCGTSARKSSAGYDLTHLLCGSEGTLGIVTKITVKLHPLPSDVAASVCAFETLRDAAAAVVSILRCGIGLDRCELLDATAVRAFNSFRRDGGKGGGDQVPLPEKPHLFFEYAGTSPASVDETTSFIKNLCVEDYEAINFETTRDDEERRRLWDARHELYYASLALRKGSNGALITDACVPFSKFAAVVEETAKDVDDLKVLGVVFGHAGDGNFHCILPLLEGDEEDYLGRVREVNERLIRRTITAGGTCTGEHGVGFGKMKYLPLQYGDGAVDMMKMIKKAIDPLNIMNPGKIVDIDDKHINAA